METSDINHDQNMTPVQFDEVVTWSLADFTGLNLNCHTGKWWQNSSEKQVLSEGPKNMKTKTNTRRRNNERSGFKKDH